MRTRLRAVVREVVGSHNPFGYRVLRAKTIHMELARSGEHPSLKWLQA